MGVCVTFDLILNLQGVGLMWKYGVNGRLGWAGERVGVKGDEQVEVLCHARMGPFEGF